ncbi:MAG: M56 family metallopeptidase [Saprospiraceae bacterium]|nr:M56 family metallopeptidase [Saprospiraceae bacterium]
MNNIALYLLQSSICLIVFYGIYWLFLRKDTFFNVNRFLLTGSIVFSLTMPLLDFSLSKGIAGNYYYILESIDITANGNSISGWNINFNQLLATVYITGFIIFSLRFLVQLLQIYFLVKRYGITSREGLKFVFLDRTYYPFSFFDIIFLNKKDIHKDDIDSIIAHEHVHVRQMHTIDLMIIECATIILWFNPFVWFYRYSIKTLHEFLADEGVVLNGFDKINYQKLMLAQCVGVQVNDLTNNFNHSLIKRRIQMLSKSKTKKAALLKMLIILPITLFLTILFAFNWRAGDVKYLDNITNPAAINYFSFGNKDTSKVYMEVEEKPEFIGGDEARIKFIQSNLTYPESARKNGIQGTVYIEFIIEKDGTVSDVKVLRGFNEDCEKEAVRVVSAMTKWKPGKMKGKPVRVKFVMPIKFKLGDK